MKSVKERFLAYAAIDTESSSDCGTTPSSEGQRTLAGILADEMRAMGVEKVKIDEKGFVYGMIPSNLPVDCEEVPVIGLIAHMDTAPGTPGAAKPQLIRNYPGGSIRLGEGTELSPERYPELENYIGQDLLVTDGTTLLGADDKAGVAEIMSMTETLLASPEILHGKIAIAFTPDEETGSGIEHFDLKEFGADFAYTVDGGAIGEIEYENFNGATANVMIQGNSTHPGYGKNVMISAVRIAEEFDFLLPAEQRPEYTEGYEGFFYLMELNGTTERAEMCYIIREHDEEKYQQKKKLLADVTTYLNAKYGNVVSLEITDGYRNMKEKILPHIHLVQRAEEAFRACGVEPKIVPIRGGTDGAELSYMGLPCPNLSAGGHNFHTIREYLPIQSMETMVDVLIKMIQVEN